MSNPTVTREDAETVLALVRAQFHTYLEPLTLDDTTYEPTCPEPTLIEDYDGAPFVVAWEDGPDDWAYRFTVGGSSEEERILAAEFGATITPDEPAVVPDHLRCEPIYSFVLGIYPE